MQSAYCPLCSKKGAKVRVIDYQINFQEAVFMCSTEDCTWPAGYHDVLFMHRPIGKYYSKDWPAVADKYLAEHLKKQRNTLSTPGNSKDIHDTSSSSMAGSSSLPVVKDIEILGQQPSTSKSQPIEIPVINLTDHDSPTLLSKSFRTPVISSTSLVRSTIHNKPVSLESKSNLNMNKLQTTSVVDPFPKHSALLDNNTAAVNNIKANPVPEKRIAQSQKFDKLDKQKSKSCIKPFPFDQVREEKSAKEQSKAAILVKSVIDVKKMKPAEVKDAIFVKNNNNLVNVPEINSDTNYTMRFDHRRKMLIVEKKICQSNVNSQIDLKKISNTSSVIKTLSGDQDRENVNKTCLELSKKETIKEDNTPCDMDKMMDVDSSSDHEIKIFEQQPSTSKSQPIEIPVINVTDDDSFTRQQPSSSKSQPKKIEVIDLIDDDSSTGQKKSFHVPVLNTTRSTIHNKPVSLKSKSNLNVNNQPFTPTHTLIVNPFPKRSVLLNNKIAAVNNVKANPLPEKRIVFSDNVKSKRFCILGEQKSKSCNYTKPFEESTKEQSKAQILVKNNLDLGKMKPDVIRDAIFQENNNNLVDVRKTNSNQNNTLRLEPRSQFNVNIQIEVENKMFDASSLVQILSGDQDSEDVNRICLELSKKETIKDDNIHYDSDKTINASPAKLESDKNWPADHDNLDCMLAMLHGDKVKEQSLPSDDKLNDTSTINLPNDEDCKFDAMDEDSDHDILLCSLDDGEASFFTSLFSTMGI